MSAEPWPVCFSLSGRFISGLGLIWLAVSCQPVTIPTNAEQLAIERELIQAYVRAEGLEMDSLASGVYFLIENKELVPRVRPSGPPNASHWVKIEFTASRLDGTRVGQSANPPARLLFRRLMPGLQAGLGKFRNGQSGVLIIPSREAYGRAEFPDIPANTILRFDIRLAEMGPEKD